MTVGVAFCLAMLWWSTASSELARKRSTLEELSRLPPADAVGTGDATLHLGPGIPTWARVTVDDGREVLGVDVSSPDDFCLKVADAQALVELRDACATDPFAWGGRTWIALWQPVGTEDDAIVVSADGEVKPSEGAVDGAGEASGGGRLYVFLDISDYVEQIVGLGAACLAAAAAVLAASLAIGWFAAGMALLPVAQAEARQREFVCAASHDLKTPLMAVTANCDVLEAEAGGDPALMPWIGNIRAAADDMAGRIADMLTGLDR
ncbi:sensor histidine kinase [Enorma phocaeensis]|uniref:histidine kinase n=1 Tax=Enorma phocaeensis TaxID=1871019 RepID=A0ABT7V9Y3_9ACTN|nr:histidine kinase dimerization/phospho-acceptor domain-containing protein [Enorma phocaeensis]MDM8275310.1 histidine kinase dimerization/phospho-acceptor domain-containing protein [Enorma phocaeensis]